jgi:hypothetical protein
MKTFAIPFKIAALAGLAWAVGTGCESMDDGSNQVSGSMYYGGGSYDPWYYGGYYDDADIVVTPPGDRPTAPPRPTHPIAPAPGPRPMPMPSIPSSPRPSLRR